MRHPEQPLRFSLRMLLMLLLVAPPLLAFVWALWRTDDGRSLVIAGTSAILVLAILAKAIADYALRVDTEDHR